MPEAIIRAMRKINPWLRLLIFVAIVTLVGVSTYLITANLVPPLTAQTTLTLDPAYVPNADTIKDLAAEFSSQRIAASKAPQMTKTLISVATGIQEGDDLDEKITSLQPELMQAMINRVLDVAAETENIDELDEKITAVQSELMHEEYLKMLSGDLTNYTTNLQGQLEVAQTIQDLRGRLKLENGKGLQLLVVAQAETEEDAIRLADAYAAVLNEQISAKLMKDMGTDAAPANVLGQAEKVPSRDGRVVIAVVIAVAITALLAFIILSGQPLFDSFNTIFFLAFTVLCVFPFYYLFINTISDNQAVTSGRVNFLPTGLHIQNYIGVFEANDIPAAFAVTTARTIIGTVLMVLVSAWAGYLVTKKKMWRRSFMYRALVMTMYFNAGLIPWYMNMYMLGLTNTFLAYILPGLVAPYNIILVKTYIESIPASLEESAVIDGANTPTVFLRIILPLSVPILATIAIFGAVGNWNSFQDSLLLMDEGSGLQTLQHRLYIHLNRTTNMAAQASGSGGLSQQAAQNMLDSQVLKYTISMVTVIPILLVYPFMQRFFVKGIMLGAVKG